MLHALCLTLSDIQRIVFVLSEEGYTSIPFQDTSKVPNYCNLRPEAKATG